MQRERISILKIITYAALLVLLHLVETSSGVHWRILGFRLDVLPAVMAAVALLDGPVEGVILGLITGVLYDIGFTGTEGMYPLYFMLFGVGAGLFSHRYLRKIFPSMLLITACSMLFLDLFRYGFLVLMGTSSSFLIFMRMACGETLVTLIFTPAVYLAVRFISRRFEALSR